jgi:hypothetical protein
MKVLKPGTCRLLLATLLVSASAAGQPAANLSTEDRGALEALMSQYAQALAGCRAAEFADLFVPETGYFASGFRGRMVGRKELIGLVESERQCTIPASAQVTGRAGGVAVPTLTVDVTAGGIRGIAKLGAAEYQDEYVKTPQGWRFASRTVIMANEKAAGLDARGMLAIQRLGGDNLGDHYEADKKGVSRLQTSGVKISVSGGQVTGRTYLKDGRYSDAVYEKLASGEWAVKSALPAR